jgi:hypothetical protein
MEDIYFSFPRTNPMFPNKFQTVNALILRSFKCKIEIGVKETFWESKK